MATEIEYKFLVNPEKWQQMEKPEPQTIVQGFLSKSADMVVRVRIMGHQGFLTIKGKTEGLRRSEFEYPIPVDDAEEMIRLFTDKHIRKNRYIVHEKGHDWEVDVFEGKLAGLILAELEVSSEDEKFEKPDWITRDVSTDPNYFNAVLIEKC
ncbi:MAG: CYTH domain-containing protein [Bacteroidetes bacterium]|nr:MAG: CYTH domain-containing protein [Bacteroidota bacterium]